MTSDHLADGPGALAADARRFFDRPAPPDYLREWSDRLARPDEPPEGAVRSVVLFRLAGEYLAIETRWLLEVSPPRPIHSIPHRAGGVLLGLVNMRGQLRLCVSLHALLGVEPASEPPSDALAAPSGESDSRMLIAQDRNDPWVFPVEEVLGIVRPSESELREVPATFGKASSFSRAVFTRQGHTVGYLDEARLFSALRSACT
jgi:chemotaxis-related protein WspD